VLKTLDRLLSKAGLCSRTEAAEWITRGRVKVNAKPVKDPEHWVDPERDAILVDGRPLCSKEKIYLLLYKPKGFITTYKDPDGRPTVYDLIQNVGQWVFPVGRLDQDTSGLLIMTNDTDLAERLTNPEYHVPKTYLVKASAQLSDEQLERLRTGLELKDGPTRPADVTRIRDTAAKTFFEITITEGRNRQVRRMVEALDAHVSKLVRVSIGALRIGTLQIGHWRAMTQDEVRALRHAARGVGDGHHDQREAEHLAVPEVVLEQPRHQNPYQDGDRRAAKPRRAVVARTQAGKPAPHGKGKKRK
jgi:pseudouridine synthase